MQRWAIKSHWLPVDIKKRDTSQGNPGTGSWMVQPSWGDSFTKAWTEAESLADEGWELVAVAPETSAQIVVHEEARSTTAFSFTAGYMLTFRRPKS